MQIRLFLEYHQNSDLCQDIVSCKSLDAGEAEQAASRLRLSSNPCAAWRARNQVSQTIGGEEHGADDQSIIWCGLSRPSVGGLRGKRFILPQKLFNLFAGDAGAKQVSLHFITFQRPQKRGLLMGFHSLSDHLQM
jgi:hypothetical protein